MELWEPIKGMEGCYEVSNLGRVKSLKRIKQQWNGYEMVEYEIPERIRKLKYSNGYYKVNLTVNGIRQQPLVHRLVAEAFCERQEGCDYVDHKNGRKLDNRANNLRWVTQSKNVKCAMDKKRGKFDKEFEKTFGKNDTTTKTSSNKDTTKILHLETGIYYNTSREASRVLGLSDSNIRRSCRTNGKSAVRGNHFRYTI